MNEYELQSHLQNLATTSFSLQELLRLNIIKEMWNLLTLEEKRELTVKTYNLVIKNLSTNTISNSISTSELFSLINKEKTIRDLFIENNDILVKSIKNTILEKINFLISDMKNNSDISNLIKPEILKIVKESYQNILSYQGDSILKEAKAIIVKVTSEESIISYGQNLIKKAKKIVDEEIIKELIE